jgi:hypothetical protein
LAFEKIKIMKENIVEEFNAYRAKMNEKMLDDNNKIIKRIFNLDTKEEVVEGMSISLLIGGTIVIPHLRRAFEYWEALEAK